MFQSVRPNSPIYILHKGDNARLETGYVVNQPIPKPKYPIPHNFGQPQEMIVDLIVKINDTNVNYNSLPAQADISDSYSNGESITISDSKDAMNAEIMSAKQKSIDVINSVGYHKALIEQYDKLLSDFNPEVAEKQAQQQEMASMREKMDEMTRTMNLLMQQFKGIKHE
jgi:hypothetical protein